MKKKNARPDKPETSANTSPNNSDASAEAQRYRLLKALRIGPVTTIQARTQLNIMMPAARIKELRDNGKVIATHRINILDDQGRMHSGVGKYILLGEKPEEEAA